MTAEFSNLLQNDFNVVVARAHGERVASSCHNRVDLAPMGGGPKSSQQLYFTANQYAMEE